MKLIKDSKGHPSWTLTFCVIGFAQGLIIMVYSYFNYLGPIVEYSSTIFMATVGAFVARDVTKKIVEK